MSARSVRLPLRGIAALALAPALLIAACSGGDPTTSGGPSAAATSAGQAARSAAAGTGALPEACSLVPPAQISAASGLEFARPAGTGGAARTVCAFGPGPAGVGLSVGVEPAARFEAKADASRNSVGVAGTEVPGLGDRALFFYSDADLPTGVGGVLVSAGGTTLDVTLQGAGDEARTRDAAVAVAKVALSRL
ncbi:DUF3558 family protein [Pseudonocardia acidicola]|uniref:DUF3558 domain-containing protein n=1 Tax=Pseudonocardia acidicola TaxID=2724939 RepID=A0ABX1S329_9PSEU|nr:DUF3558 family protein [Pseudonocardia acidicola]NMH95945.1 hypothetical protein [Pseudonocardia acidicola]